MKHTDTPNHATVPTAYNNGLGTRQAGYWQSPKFPYLVCKVLVKLLTCCIWPAEDHSDIHNSRRL